MSASRVKVNASLELPRGWCLAQIADGVPVYLGPLTGLPTALDYERLFLSPELMAAFRRMLADEPPPDPPAAANAA